MLSLSFVTANAAYLGVTVLLVAVAPLFTIVENNTENEAFCGAKAKVSNSVRGFVVLVITNIITVYRAMFCVSGPSVVL